MSRAKSDEAKLTNSIIAMDWQRGVLVVLCMVGMLIAGYMSWAELTDNETVCVSTAQVDCKAVQESAYSKMLGIPVAMMGLLGYIAILGVLIAEEQMLVASAYGRTIVLGMALFGVIFQLYLTYVEAAVLEKWCLWCVASFVVIGLICLLSAYRAWRFLQPLQR